MNAKTLNLSSHFRFQNPNNNINSPQSFLPHVIITSRVPSSFLTTSLITNRRSKLACISPIDQNLYKNPNLISDNDEEVVSTTCLEVLESEDLIEEVNVEIVSTGKVEYSNIWKQMKEIALFAGPAVGLWVCAPLMSLIDTAIIGQGSSIELAALGPATVVCDYMSYVFMFLSIATSNMVATSLVTQNKSEVQHTISMLLFVGLTCGVGMLLITRLFGEWTLAAFTGPTNLHIVPAANTYVQIRGLAWPAILVGWVYQSASLGMKDPWGPLKALAVASVVNGLGDIVLCSFLGYGIAGAAWATMVSQVVAALMMIGSLKNKGYNAFTVTVPSPKELLQIFQIAAPVFVTMISKVAFFSFLAYFATSMGTNIIAAHQVMIQVFCMCAVWGEPLSQSAQSFMPEFLSGVNKSLEKARMLLKSLLIIGAMIGSFLAIVGTCVPWLCPYLFTTDGEVIREMHKVLLPYLIALSVTPSTLSLEGTLLAGRDLRFLSLSMSGCFSIGGLLLLMLFKGGFGLPGCWWSLAAFQWARFSLALWRLTSPTGFINSDKLSPTQLAMLETA